MKILVNEKLSEHKFKDKNGYLICTDCILSRVGKQKYRRSEIVNDDSNEEVEVNRVYAKHASDNPNSGKVMKKVGLLYEATQRKARMTNQGISDVCLYAMLKEDFGKLNK